MLSGVAPSSSLRQGRQAPSWNIIVPFSETRHVLPIPGSLFRIVGLGMSDLVVPLSYRLTRSRVRREVTMLPCQAGGDHASVSGGMVLPPASGGKACSRPLTAYRHPSGRSPPCSTLRVLPAHIKQSARTGINTPVSPYPGCLSGTSGYFSFRRSTRSHKVRGLSRMHPSSS